MQTAGEVYQRDACLSDRQQSKLCSWKCILQLNIIKDASSYKKNRS